MLVEIYADIACPWCYVGRRRFERALASFPGAADVETLYRPYQLNPAEPDRPTPLPAAMTEQFGAAQGETMLAEMTAIGRHEGIDFRMDRGFAVNTFQGHRLAWLAAGEYGHETQSTLMGLLFAAYFTEGGNVGDPALLADLAARAGMNRERVAAFLASNEGADEVRDRIDAARADGIRSVPTYIVTGGRRLSGAQEPSTLLRMLEDAAAAEDPGGHAGTGGACAVPN